MTQPTTRDIWLSTCSPSGLVNFSCLQDFDVRAPVSRAVEIEAVADIRLELAERQRIFHGRRRVIGVLAVRAAILETAELFQLLEMIGASLELGSLTLLQPCRTFGLFRRFMKCESPVRKHEADRSSLRWRNARRLVGADKEARGRRSATRLRQDESPRLPQLRVRNGISPLPCNALIYTNFNSGSILHCDMQVFKVRVRQHTKVSSYR